ncbi:MAG: 5-formyltetrahydrofolate cyclo-ligase [Leeuwenhoekiella sp.]
MKKVELRKKYKALRNTLSTEDIDKMSLAIANQALKADIWNHSFYHIFLPVPALKEVNTEYILSILSGKDKNIVISKSDTNKINLTHYLLTDNTTLKVNKWGVPEPTGGIIIDPSQLDVVFIPLLVYDIKGNRIGYGKGFYDAFLKNCREDCLKVGLSFFRPEDEFNAEIHDMRLTHCITVDEIHKFLTL